jgi:hypothetical protein
MKLPSLFHSCGVPATALALVIFSGCAYSTGPAQAGAAPAAAAPASAVASAAAEPKAATAPAASPYEGRFESECNTLDPEGLHYNDVMELSTSGKVVTALYSKVFYGSDTCAPNTLIATVSLPPTRWDLEGSATVGGKLVDHVTVTLTAGKLSAKAAPTGKITETDDTLVIYYGKDAKVPITRLTEASVDKDLRLISKGQMWIGDIESPKIGGYPSALDQNSVFKKK